MINIYLRPRIIKDNFISYQLSRSVSVLHIKRVTKELAASFPEFKLLKLNKQLNYKSRKTLLLLTFNSNKSLELFDTYLYYTTHISQSIIKEKSKMPNKISESTVDNSNESKSPKI